MAVLVIVAGIYLINGAGLSGSSIDTETTKKTDSDMKNLTEESDSREDSEYIEALYSEDGGGDSDSLDSAVDESLCDIDIPRYDMKEYMTIMENMTLREKVGQLFIIRPESIVKEYRGYEIGLNADMRAIYEDYPCGGFALFEKNITDEMQIIKFTTDLHALKYAPLLCIDEEGGSVSRISNHPNMPIDEIPNMQDIAETDDAYEAYKVGDNIGSYLKKYGFDVDLAPVADVNTNPDNPIIGVRAFGDDPVTAGAMVAAVVEGLHNNNIGACLKHYPGHGDTKTDTHLGYAETTKDWEEILNCEMVPFIAGINANADMIMVAHIAAPRVTGSDEPATLSYTLITEKLRNELHYDGIIITDAIEMKAITSVYSSGEAAVKCIQAGVDIVLMPENYIEAFDAVVKAVEDGIITEERINESLLRILRLKAKY